MEVSGPVQRGDLHCVSPHSRYAGVDSVLQTGGLVASVTTSNHNAVQPDSGAYNEKFAPGKVSAPS